MNYTSKEIAWYTAVICVLFLGIGFYVGRATNVDLKAYSQLDEAMTNYQKLYYDAKKEAYLYKGLDASCLQELNEYREEYGIKAP